MAVATAQPVFKLPTALLEMLAPPRLLRKEDEDAYTLLRDQLLESIQPRDVVEMIWVLDLTESFWEERRARHAKQVRIKLAQRKAVEEIWRSRIPDNAKGDPDFEFELQGDVSDILLGNEPAYGGFKLVCADLGLKPGDVEAVAFQTALKDLEALQKLIDRSINRRIQILREIDRSREIADRARRTVATIEAAQDAEFE
ncbi:hypothetical protein [Phenylobacterium conjunctum]|uniref:Uncharacterized protein n=1 Tax=Phenylobacterium conjunctum TaxID=1298959 RepID=A0ABW3T5F0_9CAUL